MADFSTWDRATLEQFAQEATDKLVALRKAQGEPVGIVGSMPGASGFTMASFEADKVPVGTKLYTSVQSITEPYIWFNPYTLELISDHPRENYIALVPRDRLLAAAPKHTKETE